MSGTLTTIEFASAVGCPVPTVHGWISRGLLVPVGKDGKRLLFDGSLVEKMKAYRADNPAKAKPLSSISAPLPLPPVTPMSPEISSVVTSIAKREEVWSSGHRYWKTGTPSAKPETLSFGPLSLSTVVDNTLDGQGMVPSLDDAFAFDAGEAVVLANAIKNAEPTWIWGPSGGGKTSGITQMCALLNLPLYRINMSGDMTVADFVGSTKVVIDEATGNAITQFIDGVLLKAMINGGVLLIDEVTATPASVLMALQAILERPGANVHQLWAKGESHALYVNTENGGEVIHAHPRFRVLVTDNTNGQGDITGAYSGTHVMNEAFRSRFSQWLKKGYPETHVWTRMVAKKCNIASANAERIVRIAVEVNKGSALLGATKVTNQTVINPRDTLSIARLFLVYGDIRIAFKIGLLDSMNASDSDRQFIMDLISNIEK